VIVFVHGILSSGESAWGQPSWPELLAAESEFDGIGIYVFTYQTSLRSRTYGIADVAEFLREHLRLNNLLAMRKIVFVCHSMGGIAVRRYLVANQRELIAKKLKIGLLLVASPSLGSRDANMLSLLSFALQHTQAAVLRFSQANTSLDELHRDFRTLLAGGELSVEGRELTEDRPIAIKRWFGLWRQVVEPFAASQYFTSPGCEPFRVPGSDHASIVKPLQNDAVQHLMLKRFISERIIGMDDATEPLQLLSAHLQPPVVARRLGLKSVGGNSLCIAYDPLLRRTRGTGTLQLRVALEGDFPADGSAVFALRQAHSSGWSRTFPSNICNEWSWAIEPEPKPYELALAVVGDLPPKGNLRITVSDEFGGKAEKLESLEPARRKSKE
jgi:pimeloyl-ACP methyl ester carboxylesterase